MKCLQLRRGCKNQWQHSVVISCFSNESVSKALQDDAWPVMFDQQIRFVMGCGNSVMRRRGWLWIMAFHVFNLTKGLCARSRDKARQGALAIPLCRSFKNVHITHGVYLWPPRRQHWCALPELPRTPNYALGTILHLLYHRGC